MDLTTVERLRQIFSHNGWPLAGVAFDRCAHVAARLTRKQRVLFLDLLRRFEVYDFESYANLLSQALAQVPTGLIRGRRIFFVPILTDADAARAHSKSGGVVTYLTKVPGVLPAQWPTNFTSLDRPGALGLDEHLKRRPSTIVLLDDFIGTGETASTALQEYHDAPWSKDRDQPILVCLMALEEGLNRLRKSGVNVYSAKTSARGISDHYDRTQLTSALANMRQIEEYLSVTRNPEYQFGYGASEALVKMIRTPNNTFPVFWCKEARVGEPWPAPFER